MLGVREQGLDERAPFGFEKYFNFISYHKLDAPPDAGVEAIKYDTSSG